ncbi:MAG: DUF1549 domain-containing protein, partial [Planctomycetota bacterium]
MTMPRALLACCALAAAAAAQQPAPPFARLDLVPAAVQVDSADDRPRVVVIATSAAGFQSDVTAEATFTFTNAGIANLQSDGTDRRVVAAADGTTELLVRVGAQEVRLPVQVRGATASRPASFSNDVLPILTRAGCNGGSCHGAAAGKNGFPLSLFAYDPPADHRMLTRELKSRRVDTAQPELSMMLQKASGRVPHQGGKRLPADSDEYRRVVEWIAGGAGDDAGQAPAVQRLELLPPQALLLVRSALPLTVVAHYSDGSDRDVTALALWSSNDDGAVAVGSDGRATAVKSGEAAILARFAGLAAIAQVQALADDRPWTWPAVAAASFVDDHVHSKLARARVAPAAVCSDEVFVRRAFLDLVALLPSSAEVRAFVADPDIGKRAHLVDELLRRPQWAAVQAMAWADTLLVDAERMEPKGASQLTGWLREQFATARPFDAIVTELMTAEGASFATPPANYWLAADQPHLLAEHTAQNFLGIRLQCAQCHNHPFENWSMDDYYGFAGFFAQLARKRGEDGAEWIVWDRRSGEVRNKRTGAVTAPRFLRGARAELAANTDRRTALARWLTAAANPWFARNVANRVWSRLFGRGLVDPVDDVRIGNPASHPELLQELAALLVRERFDLRALYRTICTSRTYQLARHPDAVPPALFAGNAVRRLSAEQLLDAIGAVTGVPSKYPGLPPGEPATAIASGRSNVRFLD